jgi:hypothetical protein
MPPPRGGWTQPLHRPFLIFYPHAFPADVYAFNGVEHARYHHAVLHILVSPAHPPLQLPAVDWSAHHAQAACV